MKFFFHKDASLEPLHLKGDAFHYLVKVRRHRAKEIIYLRNPNRRSLIYKYRIESISNRDIDLTLLGEEERSVKSKNTLHIGWCIIDAKSIQKTLPTLNELGVERISFIYCDRSQKNIKLDLERFRRVCDTSCMQCGRSSVMEFEVFDKLEDFSKSYPDAAAVDFSTRYLQDAQEAVETIVVGCEGGFSDRERSMFNADRVYGLNTPLTLKSETAAIVAASTILLK